MGGISLYPLPLVRRVRLVMGLYTRALYNGLILCPCFIMILCCGLVFLRFSVMILCYSMRLYRGLAPIGFESYVLKVLSRFYNAIDSGTGKPGAGTACPGGHTPGGGQRPGAGAAGSGLSTPKIEKETKRI